MNSILSPCGSVAFILIASLLTVSKSLQGKGYNTLLSSSEKLIWEGIKKFMVKGSRFWVSGKEHRIEVRNRRLNESGSDGLGCAILYIRVINNPPSCCADT